MTITCGEVIEVKNDAPQHVLDTYTQTLDENFTGTSLDPNVWNTHYPWGSTVIINGEEQYYPDTLAPGGDPYTNADPFSFDGDNLIITAEAAADPSQLVFPTGGQPGGQTYISGVVTTFDSHQFQDAYVEVCAQLPCDAQGSWPAFWLHKAQFRDNGNPAYCPEVDFMEAPNNGGGLNTTCIRHAYHYHTGEKNTPDEIRWSLDGSGFDGYPQNVQGNTLPAQYQNCQNNFAFSLPATCEPGVDYCQGFHTYATDYCPSQGYIDYYVDGVRVHCVRGIPFATEPMYLIMNVAVGGFYPGPSDPADYPAQTKIDYARIWEKV